MLSTTTAQNPKHPPLEAWRTIKPVFLDLYLRQAKTLNEVRFELETKYSFFASVKAYKLKVKQWNAQKYQKRRIESSNTNKKVKASSVSIVGKANQSNLNAMRFSWEDQSLSLSHGSMMRGFQPKDFTNSTIRINPYLDESDSTGYLFSAARNFWQWTIQSTSSPMSDHIRLAHVTPAWELVNTAILLSIPSSYQSGLSKLLEAQEDIVSKVESSPAAALVAVTALFTYDKWHFFPRVQDVIFNLVRGYSLRHLPLQHPLRKFFEHVSSDDMRLVSGRLIMIQIDTLIQIQKEGLYVPDWFFGPPTWGLIQVRLLKEANNLSMKRLQQAESKVDHHSVLSMVLRCQFYNHDYDECISTGQSILKTAQALMAEGEFVWGQIVAIYDVIAKCYYAKGDNGLAVKYFWLAFKTSMQQFGMTCTGSKFYHQELDICLHENGRWEDLRFLKSEYSFMFPPEETARKEDIGSSKDERDDYRDKSADKILKTLAYC